MGMALKIEFVPKRKI